MSSVWKDCKWGIIYLILIISIPFLPHADRWLKPKIDHESLRGLGLYVLGAGVGVLGLYLTRSRTESLRKQTEALEMQTEIEKSKNVTDAFAKSVELLGNKRAAARQGGIYALDKIAKDDPEKYHMTVIRIMTSYIREESKESYDKYRSNMQSNSASSSDKKDNQEFIMPADVEAAIEVIRQRNSSQKQEKQSKKKLQRYTLFLDISNAHLSNTDFSRAELSKTNFSNSNLSGCIFDHANLSHSSFVFSDLKDSSFEKCDLSGADLSEAKNLTQEQISKAKIGEDTMLPPDIENSQYRSSSEQT